MSQLRVLLGFATASDHVVEETVGHLLGGLYGSAAATFPNPPYSKANLQTALTAFTNTVAAQKQGGTTATANKAVARDAVIAILRVDALYVQGTIQPMTAANALAALLASGFEAVSNNRTQEPLAVPGVLGIDNDGAGRLRLRVNPVRNARTYEVQYRVGAGEWVSAGLFQNTRKTVVTGLTAGTVYTFQMRAVGGSTGYSEWSDPVSHMSL